MYTSRRRIYRSPSSQYNQRLVVDEIAASVGISLLIQWGNRLVVHHALRQAILEICMVSL